MSEQRFTTPRPVRLEVTAPAGEIAVTNAGGDESVVTLEGSQKLLETMEVELIGDRLVIRPRRRTRFGLFDRWGDSLRVQASVPPGSSVQIVTAASHARLTGHFGGLDMQSASGDVVLSGTIDGDATVKTVSGDVRLPTVAGDLSVRSVSGNVVAESVARSVSVKSVSGHLRVGSLREGNVKVQTVSGDLELGIAAGTNVDVDAGSASGQLTSEIPLAAVSGAESGPTVVIRGNTASGNVRIFRAAA